MSLVTTTLTSAPRRGRRIIAGLSSLALPFVLAGCYMFSPMATENMYNPGDGVSVELGQVVVRDLLVVGTTEEESATLLAYVVNNSTDPVTVDFTIAGETVSVDLDPHEALQVSPPGEDGASFASMGAAPGAMVPVQVSVDGSPAAELGAPTVTPDNPMYADYGG